MDEPGGLAAAGSLAGRGLADELGAWLGAGLEGGLGVGVLATIVPALLKAWKAATVLRWISSV